MSDNLRSQEQQRKRARAVKTAWILGFIAFAIFAAFIGAAVTGR
jgi:uncharacterized membrane protein YoaK (UPF0700 family)